jgi:hypothetical protein
MLTVKAMWLVHPCWVGSGPEIAPVAVPQLYSESLGANRQPAFPWNSSLLDELFFSVFAHVGRRSACTPSDDKHMGAGSVEQSCLQQGLESALAVWPARSAQFRDMACVCAGEGGESNRDIVHYWVWLRCCRR